VELASVGYYLIKGLDLQPRAQVYLSTIVRALHLFLGKALIDVDGSMLYKHIKKIPNWKQPAKSVATLTKVRSFFEAVGLKKSLYYLDKDLAAMQRQ